MLQVRMMLLYRLIKMHTYGWTRGPEGQDGQRRGPGDHKG